MSREIKFRGKNITTGEWVFGCLVNNLWVYSECHSLHGQPVTEIIISGEADDWSVVEDELVITIDPATLGQFTGLLDNNGKGIYEGDVLIPFSEGVGPYWITFENGSFVCYSKFGRWGLLSRAFEPDIAKLYTPEVIGNIFENQELIKP